MSNSGGTWSAQVNSALHGELTDYKEELGLSKSETVRTLLREGVESRQSGTTSISLIEYLWSMAPVATLTLIVAAGLFFFTSYLDSPGFIGLLVVVTFVVNVVPLWRARSSGGDS